MKQTESTSGKQLTIEDISYNFKSKLHIEAHFNKFLPIKLFPSRRAAKRYQRKWLRRIKADIKENAPLNYIFCLTEHKEIERYDEVQLKLGLRSVDLYFISQIKQEEATGDYFFITFFSIQEPEELLGDDID